MPFAFGGPVCSAAFKQNPEDFVVIERLPFTADGDGSHWLIEVEKTDMNTLDLLDAMSRCLKVPRRAAGYSGLKDRYATTRQYVTLPVSTLSLEDVLEAGGDTWRVIGAEAHRRKLRVGSHRQNAFEITLRDIPADDSVRELLAQRLEQTGREGVPNYFGPQRFGIDGTNLRKATQLFGASRKLPRQQHRFAVSAARALVFNTVLAQRVGENTWRVLIDGEAVCLDGSSSWFDYAKLGDNFQSRLGDFDVHPSGPMWGAGALPVTGEALRVELAAVTPFGSYTKGLEELGLKHDRRALRQRVHGLSWEFGENTLRLSFALNKGGFATSVLREVVAHRELVLGKGGSH